MDRRWFLRALGAAAVGAVLDPEKLLWVPGQKTIFLPSPAVVQWNPLVEAGFDAGFVVGDVFTMSGKYAINPVTGRSTGHLQQFIVKNVTSGRIGIETYPLRFPREVPMSAKGTNYKGATSGTKTSMATVAKVAGGKVNSTNKRK